MIEPPDDLLEDLQAALPPEQPVTNPRPPSNNSGRYSSNSSGRQGVNGSMGSIHDHLQDMHLSDEPSRGSVSSTVSDSVFVYQLQPLLAHSRARVIVGLYIHTCAYRLFNCICLVVLVILKVFF